MGLCVQYIHIHTLYMDIHYFCVYLTNTHYPASGTATTTHLRKDSFKFSHDFETTKVTVCSSTN